MDAYAGRQDVVDTVSLIAIVDDDRNPVHPPQWFVRTETFACLNPAPSYTEELEVDVGERVAFRYAIGIAGADANRAAEVAESARGVVAEDAVANAPQPQGAA